MRNTSYIAKVKLVNGGMTEIIAKGTSKQKALRRISRILNGIGSGQILIVKSKASHTRYGW